MVVGKDNIPYIDAMGDFVKSVFANMRESIPSSGRILRTLRVSAGTQMIYESDQIQHEFLYMFFLRLHDQNEGSLYETFIKTILLESWPCHKNWTTRKQATFSNPHKYHVSGSGALKL